MATAKEPPEGVHYYESAEDVPWEISKYWHQRHNIFSKYDDGIWMTHDAWFGVTPAPVAKYVLVTPSNPLPSCPAYSPTSQAHSIRHRRRLSSLQDHPGGRLRRCGR